MNKEEALKRLNIDNENILTLINRYPSILPADMHDIYYEVLMAVACPDCSKYYELVESVQIGGEKFTALVHRKD